MRFIDSFIVIVLLLQLHFVPSTLAFSFSSIHRGRAAARAKESRQETVGAGKEHNDCDLLDHNNHYCAVKDEFAPIRKGSIAAGVMGTATAQLVATKAFAVVGLAGAITSASVDDINTFQYSRRIRDEISSESPTVLKMQRSMMKTAPASRISIALSSNILADDTVDTSIVDRMIEKMASVNEKAQAERIDEADMKRKIQDVKKKALEDVQSLEIQAVKEKSDKLKDSITSGQTKLDAEDDKLVQQKGSADAELREQYDASQVTAEQRATDEADAKMKEQQEAERVAAEQKAKAEAEARLKEQQEAERVAAEQKAKAETEARLKEQQEAEREAAEQKAKAEAEARLKEQQEVERVAAEQKAKAEVEARLKEQQEAERVAAEEKAKAEAEARLKQQQEVERVAAEQKAKAEAEARLKEQQEAERVAAEQRQRDEEIESLKNQLEAERQEIERLAAEQKARDEAMIMLKKQQEAERVAADAARIAEQEKLHQEREVARIEAERLAEEKLLAKLEKEEKTLIESISKLEAQVLRQEQESAKIEVERRRQEEVLAKLEAEEKARTEQIERIDAQVLKLEKEAEDAKLVLERLRKVEQAREDEANKAMEARKAMVAKIDSIKSLPSKTISGFNSRSPQLQESLDLLKSKLPTIPSLEGVNSRELSESEVVSIPSSSGQKLLIESQTLFNDFIKDVPEYAVLWAASAVLAVFVIAAGSFRNDEDNENDQNRYSDDIYSSTPYGFRGQGGMYPPTKSTFSVPNNTYSNNSFPGTHKQSVSFGSSKTSFGSPPPSQGYGMTGMNSGPGSAGASTSTKYQSPLKGSTMGSKGAGSGFILSSKGGSFGSKASFGGMPGGGGGVQTGMPFGTQVGGGGGLQSKSINFTSNKSSFLKGSKSSFGSNQIVQTGSPAGMSFGQKGGGVSNMPSKSKFSMNNPPPFAAKGSGGFSSTQGGGMLTGPGLSASNMPIGPKGGGGLSSLSKSSSGSTASPPFPTGQLKGATGFPSKPGGGLQSQKSNPTFSGNPPRGNEGGGGIASNSSSGNPPPFPTGPMKGSSGPNPGSGFTLSPKTFGKSSYKKG